MPFTSGELGGIDHHQYFLVAHEDADWFPDGAFDDEISPHMLAVPTGPAVCMTTGIAMGVISLSIEFRDEAPPAIDDREPWQAVSEVSFEATSAEARIQVLMDWTAPPFDRFDLPAGQGWYRVRAYALGRSLDFDAVVTDHPREKHLLQLWRTTGFEASAHHRVDNQWSDQGP